MLDITERKRAEAVRFQHAVIIESSEDAIISKDLGATITSWNKGAERISLSLLSYGMKRTRFSRGYAREDALNIMKPRALPKLGSSSTFLSLSARSGT